MIGARPLGSAPLSSLATGAYTQAVIDNLNLSDKLNRRVDLTIADAVSWTDNPIGYRLGYISVIDFLTLVERAAKVLPPSIDGFNLTELLTVVVINKTPAVTEQFVLTETIKAQRVVSTTIAELFSLSDSPKREVKLLPYDILSILEKLNYIISKRVGVADSLILSEAIKIIKPLKPVGDGILFKETVGVRYPIKKTVADTFGLADGTYNRILSPQTIVDVLTIFDQVSNTFGKLNVTDILRLSDALRINRRIMIIECDDINFKDVAKRIKTGAVLDVLSFLEYLSKNNIVDKISFIDSVTTNVIFDSCNEVSYVPQKGRSDSLKVTDSAKANIIRRVSIADTLPLKSSAAWR